MRVWMAGWWLCVATAALASEQVVPTFRDAEMAERGAIPTGRAEPVRPADSAVDPALEDAEAEPEGDLILSMAKGMETLGKEIMDFSRVSFEGNVQATKALFGAKTFQDLVTMQSDHARKSMDQFLAEGAKLTELSVKVAGEAMAPIQARVDLAVKQFVKPARF